MNWFDKESNPYHGSIILPPMPQWYIENYVLDLCEMWRIPKTEIFPDDPELACMYENDSLGG